MNSLEAQPIEEWTIENVATWLKSNGFDDFVNESDLRLLGMKFGRRKVFMRTLYGLIGEENTRGDRIRDLKEIFDSYDINKNGSIELDEFIEVWQTHWGDAEALLLSNDDLIETFHDINKNGDNCISFTEFLEATTRLEA